MFRKLLATIAIIAASISASAYAGNIYIAPSLLLQINTGPTSNYRGLQPFIAVGYSELLQDIYLGGEVFIIPFTGTLANNHSNGAASARSTHSYGASLIPGAMITEHILGFVRAGIINTQFPSPNTSRTGAQVGLGMQTCLTPYWDLRAEYIYSAYKSVPTIGAVKTDQVGIGLVYKVIG